MNEQKERVQSFGSWLLGVRQAERGDNGYLIPAGYQPTISRLLSETDDERDQRVGAMMEERQAKRAVFLAKVLTHATTD
jgi:hypothetical protein